MMKHYEDNMKDIKKIQYFYKNKSRVTSTFKYEPNQKNYVTIIKKFIEAMH